MKLQIIICLSVALLVAQQALATETETTSEFCWRDSYGRGVGTVPNDCGDRDKIGLLCYSKCPQGMKRFGFDCHSVCPADFRDDGLFCRRAEYGRGAGYPWKFGDSLNDKGMFKRCEKDHGRGNCEKSGLVVYPKCKAGYYAFGCCICRPATPDCNSLNLNNGIDLSCAKRIRIGDPITANCGSGKEKNAGLCYEACKTNFKGVGPVCWGQAPKDWVECGMGAATTKKTCADAIFSQVSSVGMLAFNIATMGSSKAATVPEKASRFAELKKLYDKLKDILDKKGVLKAYEKASEVMAIAGVLQSTVETASDNDVCAEDIARLGAEIASLIDPTGVADVVAAYTYPKCSKISKKARFMRKRHHKSRALRKGSHHRAQKVLSS